MHKKYINNFLIKAGIIGAAFVMAYNLIPEVSLNWPKTSCEGKNAFSEGDSYKIKISDSFGIKRATVSHRFQVTNEDYERELVGIDYKIDGSYEKIFLNVYENGSMKTYTLDDMARQMSGLPEGMNVNPAFIETSKKIQKVSSTVMLNKVKKICFDRSSSKLVGKTK